jgi:uncharacterized protein (DUF779 family)
MPIRLLATPEAAALVRQIRDENGALIFHLSGGCCEGTAPMCFRQVDFRVGPRDVLLGAIEGCPFYIGPDQVATLAGSELTVDVTEGGGDSFSLEVGEGKRFVVRSRLLTDSAAPAPA